MVAMKMALVFNHLKKGTSTIIGLLYLGFILKIGWIKKVKSSYYWYANLE